MARMDTARATPQAPPCPLPPPIQKSNAQCQCHPIPGRVLPSPMPLPALPVLAGLVAKAAGQMAVKWAPYYAVKYGVYVAMKEYGVGRTYRRLVREAKSAVQ